VVAVAAYYNGSSWTWASGPLLNQTISSSPAMAPLAPRFVVYFVGGATEQ
jgi:hypothetical protein